MNPTKLFVALAGSVVALSSTLHAEAAKSPVGHYELKNRSNFRIDSEARAPFWPIGWKKPKVTSGGPITTAVATEAPRIQLQPGNFSVTSILLGNPPLATINGRSFEEGELLPVVYGAERLRVVVRAIRDGGVWLDYEGQQIMVPIHRPELGAKHTEHKAQAAEFTIKIAPK
jgi:hypothetical protein